MGRLQGVGARCVLELRLFFTALQFFTRLPVPAWVGYQPEWMHQSARYYPLVGAVVGTLASAVLLAASLWWPPLVAVMLSMVASVWITGAFHEDGWADTCDALGGHVSRERALVIMKDSRIGSYGSVGLILMLGLKAAVLSALLGPQLHELNQAQLSHVHQVLLGWTVMALWWCHVSSRLVPVWLIRLLPYAGDIEHAKAKPMSTQVSWAGTWAATLVWALLSLALMAWIVHVGWPLATLLRALAWATGAMLLSLLWCRRWMGARLGGYTGDTLGASQQISELAGLVAWLAVVHPVTWVRW